MAFSRILTGIAVVATILQLVIVTLVSASILTVDGNTLRIIAGVIGLLIALFFPVGLGWGLVRALVSRGRQVKRGRTILGVLAGVNTVAVALALWLVPSPADTLWAGGAALLDAGEAATPDSDTTEGPETPAPKGTEAVQAAQTAFSAVLLGNDIDATAEALSHESAAALGALWMAFLDETYGDELRRKGGDESWNAVHEGLPEQPDLWRDPTTIERELTRDGRRFLARVGRLADAAAAGDGVGSLTAPLLPEALLQRAVLEPDAVATRARYREVAMNRIEVEVGSTVLDVRYEDRAWRVHLGDFGDLATRRVSPRAMLSALQP